MTKVNDSKNDSNKCVNEYLNGADKYYLSGKYDISIRTIDRWILDLGVSKVKLRILRRHDKISMDIQYEVFKALGSNPIFYGYNDSEWNINRVINYIKRTYGIEVNRRMAAVLMEDARALGYIYKTEQVYDDIGRLDELGYSIVLLDYIKIGRIKRLEVEPLGIRDYTEDVLDVNLVIGRANEKIYLDVIVSELEIVDKEKRVVIYKTSDEQSRIKQRIQRKSIINDKYDLLNRIKKSERTQNIVFISKYDKDIEKLQRKRSNIKYFIVDEGIYSELLQSKYEGNYVKPIAQYMYDDNNKNRRFRNVADISNTVQGKVESYVSKVTKYKNSIRNDIKIKNEKEDILHINGENKEKLFKIINDNFIYNI
ncbi:hypothetical protein SAMN02745248_01177 [Hathewaya proteolytica DSM 3090]|uniref:Uncharacterized protein n=1 Tax=Hathewaya proteolytica DSM 3090 TaxID=1121331 RepID=A0A1M6MUJ2_9CLOT|nr:hypothetical protein [Hathewaya proteolytica]SHJ87117.1 hypothetical protein SAMN02745248_01177 [Hathewaya proteolytica DSM 3090]